ncbi:MAG: hypothetical protein AB7O97_05830 [Planctomycetota bacterium]
MIDELLLGFLAHHYLAPEGHFTGKVVRADGSPTPWITYPARAFLEDVLRPEMKVFEYGAGSSTLYFRERCAEVHSVEHDPEWGARLRAEHPDLDLELVPEGAPVLEAAAPLVRRFLEFGFAEPTSGNVAHDTMHGLRNAAFAGYASRVFRSPKGHYDMILVDGMARGLSMYLAAAMVADDGFVVLDNSDRWQYNPLQQYLVDSGFGRVDFWGPGPINDIAWCTSFFSRAFRIRNRRVHRGPQSGDLRW